MLHLQQKLGKVPGKREGKDQQTRVPQSVVSAENRMQCGVRDVTGGGITL